MCEWVTVTLKGNFSESNTCLFQSPAKNFHCDSFAKVKIFNKVTNITDSELPVINTLTDSYTIPLMIVLAKCCPSYFS